jgi:FtsP/CotA-like multicopper oxidase with cupredoxin domain
MRIFALIVCLAGSASARVVEYDLAIARDRWSPDPSIREVPALTINGGIPGPVLRFRVGDVAKIRVSNRLPDEDTSIHWHGLLLPADQDGVPGVNTPPILPGETRVFEFPILHAGTYWYHSHSGLQEQLGVYGGIVIEPDVAEAGSFDRDEVVVLSDWTTRDPDVIMRSLMRGTGWHAVKKGTMQSVAGAMAAGELGAFWDRERSKMPAMDVSDVAYDAFLANGRRLMRVDAKPGERVRLRIINAAAATYFYLESATGPMRIVAADGPAVRPVEVGRLLIGMAETYDVSFTVPSSGAWELRATAQDGSGHASVMVGSGPMREAPAVPKPSLYRMDAHLTAAMDDAERAGDPERPLSPYRLLKSVVPTTLDRGLPLRTVGLRLTGDMTRYVWSFNGRTVAEDGVIPVNRGEVLRLELINDTMMHHPLHLHGHFFRVIEDDEDHENGEGGKVDSHAPLKHTIDVPPMGRRVIEFVTDAPGDWLFHCHLLYHMHSGMARVFSYQQGGGYRAPDLGEHGEDPLYFMAEASFQTHMSMGMIGWMNARNEFFAGWDLGIHHLHDGTTGDGHGDEHGDEPGDEDHHRGDSHEHEFEYETDFGWRRVWDPDLSTVAGWRLTNREDEHDRAFAGVEYRLPWLVHSSLQADSRGDVRVGLEKSLQLTDRISGFAGVRYDSGSLWEWTAGAEYLVGLHLSLVCQYHSEHDFGGGLLLRF